MADQPSTPAGALLSIAGLFGDAGDDAELHDVRLAMEPVRASRQVYDEALTHADAHELVGLERMRERRMLRVE